MATSRLANERPDANGLPTRGELVDGRYRIRELLGVGGMGAVYAATDQEHKAPVALKIMLPAEAEHSDAVQRFTREAKAAQAIDNEHVARVFGTGSCRNRLPYICMELLEGASLDRVQRRRGPLPIAESIDFILQACEGVAAAHARGIIHRDLKPGNLHVTPGPDGTEIVKVLDFGIAKAMTTLSGDGMTLSLTETSSTLGSPRYMSPEQLRSAKNVDARADVWSLGLILYRLLTGHTAFDGDSVGAVFAKILADPPTSLRVYRPDASVELEQAIMGCLERNVLHRYQDVAQFAEALEPLAPSYARHRPRRVREILEQAGAASPYLPLVPSQPGGSPSQPGPFELAAIAARTGAGGPGSGASASWPRSLGSPDGQDLTNTAATRRWAGPGGAAGDDSFAAAARPFEGRGPRARLGLFALGSAVFAAVAGGIGLWLLAPSDAAVPHPSGPGSTASAALGGAEGERGTHEPGSAQGGDSAAGLGQGATDAGAVTVAVELHIVPEHARVELDGVPRSDNPVRIPRSTEPHQLVVTARGFVTERRTLSAERDSEMRIELRAVGRPGRPGAGLAPSSKPTASPKGPMVDTL